MNQYLDLYTKCFFVFCFLFFVFVCLQTVISQELGGDGLGIIAINVEL